MWLLRSPQPGPPLPPSVPGLADARQFVLPGNAPAILLIHGFADTAAVMFPLARLLHDRGLHVRGFTLPGHGQSLLEFAALSIEAMHEAVATEVRALRAECGSVVVLGFSMGGLLALRTAAAESVDGVVTVCAPVELWPGRLGTRLAQRTTNMLRRRAWAVRRGMSLRDRTLETYCVQYAYYPFAALDGLYALMGDTPGVLDRVRSPVCICQSRRDDVVHWRSAQRLQARLVRAHSEVHFFPRSRHKLVLDSERDALAETVSAFVHGRIRV